MINESVTLYLKSNTGTTTRLQVDIMICDSIPLICHGSTKGVWRAYDDHRATRSKARFTTLGSPKWASSDNNLRQPRAPGRPMNRPSMWRVT